MSVCPKESHTNDSWLKLKFYQISNMELTFLGGSAATSNACVQRGSSQRRPPRAESEAFYSILLARTVQLWLHLSITWLQFLIKKIVLLCFLWTLLTLFCYFWFKTTIIVSKRGNTIVQVRRIICKNRVDLLLNYDKMHISKVKTLISAILWNSIVTIKFQLWLNCYPIVTLIIINLWNHLLLMRVTNFY